MIVLIRATASHTRRGCVPTPAATRYRNIYVHGHEGYCFRHSPKELIMPSQWEIDGGAQSMDELRSCVERNILSGKNTYVVLASMSKSRTILGEIDNDETRIIKLG